jgi:hypothetical protein
MILGGYLSVRNQDYQDAACRSSPVDPVFCFPSAKTRYFASKSCYRAPSKPPSLQPVFPTTLYVLKLVADATGLTVKSQKAIHNALPTTRRAAAGPAAITAPRQVIACLVHPFTTTGRHAQTAHGGLAAVLSFVWKIRLVSTVAVLLPVLHNS